MRRDPQHSAPSTGGGLATARWEALGTSVVLRLTDPACLPRARALVERELAAIDLACSRFRADSDLTRVNAHAGGRPVRVAPLLIEALLLALRAAELTGGDVDPTVGAALVLVETGVPAATAMPAATGIPAATGTDSGDTRFAPTLATQLRSGYTTVELDPTLMTVRVPRGIVLDLGSTAKAWAADRAARAVHEAERCGVLVSLGGDIATAGAAPPGGWRIHVTDDHRSAPGAPGQTISIASGGLATSSTAVRRWRHGAVTTHHIIDPSTGACARGPWRTVSVAAADCADANIASTAALVRGSRAPRWLEQLGLPARLLAHDGEVLVVGGWPPDSPAPAPPQAWPTGSGRTPKSDGARQPLTGSVRRRPTTSLPADAHVEGPLARPHTRNAPGRGRRPRPHAVGAPPTHADDLK